MKHYLGICLVLLVLATIAAFFLAQCQRSVRDSATMLRDAVASALRVQPEVRIRQTVIYGQTSPVAELAVLSQEEHVELSQKEQKQIWGVGIPLSQTETRLGATFRVKAGFDLRERFLVQVDPVRGEATVSLPPARILSVEPVGEVSWQEENNWLNWTTPEERQQALNDLMASARQAAVSSGILRKAEEQARQRLREVLAEANPGGDVLLEVRDTADGPRP